MDNDDVAVGSLETPVGRLSVAVTRTGVVSVSWVDRRERVAAAGNQTTGGPTAPGSSMPDPTMGSPTAPRSTAPGAPIAGLPVVDDAERVTPVLDQLAEYFAGRRRDFDLPLDWRLTSGNQHTVLAALHATVPYGASITYGELAERSGTSVPARGIGAIMGSNPLPVLVPCHRVLAHNGLGGYSGGAGVEVKRWLLALEGVLPPTLDWSPDGPAPDNAGVTT